MSIRTTPAWLVPVVAVLLAFAFAVAGRVGWLPPLVAQIGLVGFCALAGAVWVQNRKNRR